jgi:predicted metal-binding membrane protein
MNMESAVEKLLKNDRRVILVCLVIIAVLGWAYLLHKLSEMSFTDSMDGMDSMAGMAGMNALQPWTITDALLMFVMWAVMMTSMMIPSATPVILLYARVYRRSQEGATPYAPTGAFFAGYVTVWAVFSAAATLLQWGLEQGALLSPTLVTTSPILGGVILIITGIYQWNPYKNTCLHHCRSPIEFLSTRWRHGVRGAYHMGLEHGAYCLGCCWALMILLFVGGVMNLIWIAAIAVFVLVEKVTSFGLVVSRLSAGLFVTSGVVMMVAG